MKPLTVIFVAIMIVSDTFGQQPGPATREVQPEAGVAPQQPATIMLVPFDPQTAMPDLRGLNDDTIAVQTFAEQVWNKVLEKLPPAQANSFGGGIIQAQPNYNEWLVPSRTDQANLLMDALKKEFAGAPKLSPEERKAKIADLARQATEVTREIAVLDSLTQHEAVSSVTLREQMKALELERERINMELYAKQERRRALAEQMEKIKADLANKVHDDPVLDQLNRIVELRKAALKRIQDMQKVNGASIADVDDAEAKLAEAKTRAAERSELVRQSNGADVLSRMTADLAAGMVDVAELEARKHYIDTQLPNIATVTEDQLKGILQTSQYPAPSNGPPPLREELEKKHENLLYQRGVLLVNEVRLWEEAAPASQPKPSR